MNRISSETKLLMAISFLFAFCPVGLGELNSTTQIKSQKTTFEAGEPLVIEVFRRYHKTGDAIKGAFPDSMRIVVERTDGQNTSSSYILRPKNIIRDNKKGVLQCKLVAWYDGWGEDPRKLFFSIPGKYQVYIKAYPSSILKVNVQESSAKTKMGMSLVADPNDWLSFTDGVYDKNKPARMAKLAEIAEQCDNTVLGQIAAARLAIEYYEEYTSKNQDVEALMAKKTSIRIADPLLIKLDKYMKKASKLNVEMPIREEIIFKRSFTEFFKGDIETANLLLKELKTRYPKGRYGKRASGFEFQMNDFAVLGVRNKKSVTKLYDNIYVPINAFGAEVEISHGGVVVCGFPIPVKMVIKGEAAIVKPDLFNPTNPFVISLKGQNGDFTFPKKETITMIGGRFIEHHEYDHEMPLPKLKIPENKEYEFTFDLSVYEGVDNQSKYRIRGWQIPPGKYRIEFSSPGFSFHYNNQYIEIVKPDSDEKKILNEINKSIAWRRGNWYESRIEKWSMFIRYYKTFSANVDFEKLSKHSKEQIEYYLLLAQMANSDEDLSNLTLPVEDPNEFNPLFETDMLRLKYEIDYAKKKDKAYLDKQYNRIKSKRPGFIRLNEKNQEYKSIIKAFRGAILAQNKRKGKKAKL